MSSLGFAWKAARRIAGSDLGHVRKLPRGRRELFTGSLVEFLQLPPDDRRLLITASDHSMVSLTRLHRLLNLATLLPPDVPGVFAEFGVAGGGSAGLLGTIARRTGRQLWLFDSF